MRFRLGREVRSATIRLIWQDFSELEIKLLQNLDELMLRHLSVYVDPEPAVDILLCRHHFAQAALVLLHRLGLIGKNNFRIDDDREVHHHQLPQHSREGGVGKVFQADPRVEQPADLEMLIQFVLDVDVRHLASRTLIHQAILSEERNGIVSFTERIEGPLDLQEDVVLGQPLDPHARGLQCGLNSGHEAVELGDQVLMLAPACARCTCWQTC